MPQIKYKRIRSKKINLIKKNPFKEENLTTIERKNLTQPLLFFIFKKDKSYRKRVKKNVRG